MQLALPPGTCVDPGNTSRAMKMSNALLVWPEPQRGKPWGDGRRLGCPHTPPSKMLQTFMKQISGGKKTQNHLLLATLQALSQACRSELSSHTSTIHEEATVQSQMPPGRAGTDATWQGHAAPNRGQIEVRLLGHLADLPSELEPSFVPVLVLGPRCPSEPGCTSNCVSLQGRHTHTHAP